ncbi:MAG: hypothetical protein U0V64_02470 [Cyclobacteriaceae bacterium]
METRASFFTASSNSSGVTSSMAMLLFGIASLCMGSCNNSDRRVKFYNENGLLVKRQFYSDSITLMKERTYLNDTLLHGYAKAFFENGQLSAYTEFDRGKKNGRETYYYRDGVIRSEGWNIHGSRDSVWSWYDSVGRVVEEGRYDLGVHCGERRKYHRGARVYLNECYCFLPTSDGLYEYHSKFDSLGNRVFEDGHGDPVIIIKSTTFPKYRAHESFVVRIYLCPCAVRSETVISLSDTKTANLVNKVVVESGEDYYWYSYRLNSKGVCNFRVEQAGLVFNEQFVVE